ncbi:hypothetical protein HYH03_013344 [Edaphochlamys debaryana]|uniref:Uncharacterized protein n=1 Tax=Edaphochlamys debaryana TaxID=47281 RepID=A0A835XQV0_9CHLO|nr:hypothetical protein HYH03_013344 [Edaphochlamys debaryana]|eukprot:KAG2488039.1 hypothetical protein HYH03_013344 [Edaphochlamys debaryana]
MSLTLLAPRLLAPTPRRPLRPAAAAAPLPPARRGPRGGREQHQAVRCLPAGSEAQQSDADVPVSAASGAGEPEPSPGTPQEGGVRRLAELIARELGPRLTEELAQACAPFAASPYGEHSTADAGSAPTAEPTGDHSAASLLTARLEAAEARVEAAEAQAAAAEVAAAEARKLAEALGFWVLLNGVAVAGVVFILWGP